MRFAQIYTMYNCISKPELTWNRIRLFYAVVAQLASLWSLFAKVPKFYYHFNALHRQKVIWGDYADDLLPERWSTIDPEWSFLPFSGGSRLILASAVRWLSVHTSLYGCCKVHPGLRVETIGHLRSFWRPLFRMQIVL
jgi:hypothetical protein